jgi:transketolase
MYPDSPVDMRDALFDEIYRIGESDKNVIFLTDDMDAFSLRRFKQDMPDQFINIGVAEQNMINVATGLAMCGKKIFTYGIASFVTMRCFEQIKVNLCSLNLPVTIIGTGPGFSFGFDGPTHHATLDMAIMRSLPEMTIYNPSDSPLATECAKMAYDASGPVYIRLDKGTFPVLGDDHDDHSTGYRVLRPLQDTNIVSSGFMSSQAIQVADTLADMEMKVGVVDLFRPKPVSDEFVGRVINQSKRIITMEDSSVTGGIGSLVSELASESGTGILVKRIGSQDKQFITYGDREWFHEMNGLDIPSLVETVSQLLKP